MKKKFPALFLTMLLLFSVMCGGGMAAETQFIIRAPEESARAGEEFAVTVELTGNPGFSAIQFTLAYDRTLMRCISASVGPLLSRSTLSVANPAPEEGAIIAAASMEEISEDGIVADFVFRTLKDTQSFEFSLTNMVFSAASGNRLPYTVTGAQSVTTPTPLATPTPTPFVTPTIPPKATPTPTIPPETTPTPFVTAAPTPTPSVTTTPAPEEAANPEPSGGAGAASSEPRFTDTAGNWAESYILEGAERGLFGGYTDGSFQPGNRLTRAEFVMVLWNLAGRPDPAGGTPFADIAGRSVNTRSAIAWAYGAGHVSGTTETTFSPGDALTRQSAMKILFSYTGGVSGMEQMLTAIYDGKFTDSGSISAWAKPAMYWGVYHEILNGNTPTTLDPRGTITRAQLAAIMVRYTDRFPTTQEEEVFS